MPGKSYKYKEFFPDLVAGYKKEIKYLEQIGTLQKKVRKVPNTGKGMKKLNGIYNESAQIQTKILNISKLQKQKIKEINREKQKELRINKQNKDALNLKLQTEKQELVLKKKLIRDQARLNAQKKLGIRANKGLMGSINGLITRLGALAVAYVGLQTIRESIDLFKIQEQAVADNVAVFGDYSKQIQKTASDVQKVTTVGDEQFLKLTTQAKNFGLAVEDIETATKGTIGLAEKFKTAGLGQETALKGIALAYSGNFSQLERYIPSLRNAGTEAEKMTILQKEMSEGFTLATLAAKTQTGQLEQMSNEMGDVKEEIGKNLIPALLKLYKLVLKSVKGWQMMSKAIKKVFKSDLQKEAERNVNSIIATNRALDENRRLNDLRLTLLSYEKDLIEAKTEVQKNATKENIENARRISIEILLLQDYVNGVLIASSSQSDFTDNLDGNTDALDKNKKKVDDLSKAYNDYYAALSGKGEKGVTTDPGTKGKDILSDIGADFLKGGKGGEGAETGQKSFLDKLFGTPEERAEIKSDYQNIYNSLSAITGAFYDVLDKRKDSSAKKDKRRRKVQQGLDITNAIINTALAVTDVIAKAKGGVITKLAAALAIGALGGAMVSKIATSKYWKGTEYLEFGNHPKGRDTIPFMGPDGSINFASGGERIVDVPINKQLDGFPNAMLPLAVNHYKQSLAYNNNTNVERLLREQNNILRNGTQVIEKDGVIYHYKNGIKTGMKDYV